MTAAHAMQPDHELTQMLRSTMPFCETLGVVGLDGDPARVVLALDFDPRWCTVSGAFHGGALMTLADSAGALCAYFNLPNGAIGTATVESKTNFLSAATAGRAVATARPLHIGSSTVVIETEVHCGERLVTKTIQTQIVKRPRS